MQTQLQAFWQTMLSAATSTLANLTTIAPLYLVLGFTVIIVIGATMWFFRHLLFGRRR